MAKAYNGIEDKDPAQIQPQDIKETLQCASRLCHSVNQSLQTVMMTADMMIEEVEPGSRDGLETILAECENISEEIKRFQPLVKSQLAK